MRLLSLCSCRFTSVLIFEKALEVFLKILLLKGVFDLKVDVSIELKLASGD